MTETTTIVDLLTRGGLLTALVIALVGSMRGWYIWGSQHKEIVATAEKTHTEAMAAKSAQLEEIRADKNKQIEDLKRDRDYWKDHSMRLLSTTGRVVDVVEASSKHQE